MKIAVIGTGAIGGFYGIMLQNAGHEIHFLMNSDYSFVKENGITLKSKKQDSIFLSKVNVYNDASLLPKTDIIIVALKTTQNSELLSEILKNVTHTECPVILIQNGFGMEEDLSKIFPDLEIAGGVALIASHKTKPGEIIHQDYGDLDIGNYNVKNVNILEEFTKSLNEAGITSTINDLSYLRWKKLVWNMSFNGLSVVSGKTTAEILDDKTLLERCKTIMTEVIEAAKANGVSLSKDFIEDMIAFTKKMSPYLPSMKLDFDYKRPMELEYLYEKPLERAKKAGFIMTETQQLYSELCNLTKENSIYEQL